MPTPKRGPRLGAGPAHQKLLLANMASDLFRHGRIRTTEAKAKALRPYAERLITKAKAGDLHARRQVLAKLRDRDVVAYLFEDVAPRFADRNGGYTRILKLGPRAGDSARMALIELVELGSGAGEDEILDAKEQRSRGLFGRRRFRRTAPEPAVPFLPDEDEEPGALGDEPASPPQAADASDDESAEPAETLEEADASAEAEAQADDESGTEDDDEA